MKTNYLLLGIGLAAIAAFIFYSIKGGHSEAAYFAAIKKEREEKDLLMKSDKALFGAVPDQFNGLKYFEPDMKYRISAKLTTLSKGNIVVLTTNDGQEKKYLEYGYAHFSIDGIKNKLLILEVMDAGPYRGTLFLAFADETSAIETYGAGRYLDIKKVPGSSSVLLDFNKAYNPYCAYFSHFSCPFPPRENILKVAIRAGERSYH